MLYSVKIYLCIALFNLPLTISELQSTPLSSHYFEVEEDHQEDVDDLYKRLGNRYTEITFLADGCQSKVFIAKDKNENDVAIKLVKKRKGFLIGKTEVENEFRTCLSLADLPEVRRIYELVDNDILIMEFISGITLDDFFYDDELQASKAQLQIWFNEFFALLHKILDHNVIPVDIDSVNVFVNNADNSLKLIDMADYIDLNQYDRNAKNLKIYTDDFIWDFWGQWFQMTPQFFAYLTALDIYEVTNRFRKALGKKPLGEQYKPNKADFEFEVTQYNDLERLVQLLKSYVHQIETSAKV